MRNPPWVPAGVTPCVYQGDRRNSFVFGGRVGTIAPLALRDGRFLDVRMGLAIHGTPEGRRLKVTHSVFQYQVSGSGNDWIFRYEYARNPPGPHPPTHLHIRGTLTENCLRTGDSLERIHFPGSSRISLEAVIRLLIEEFHVVPVKPRSFWRPLLTETERAFLDIAHRAPSRPRR